MANHASVDFGIFQGYFWSHNNTSNASSPVAGTFHSDYKALTKKVCGSESMSSKLHN